MSRHLRLATTLFVFLSLAVVLLLVSGCTIDPQAIESVLREVSKSQAEVSATAESVEQARLEETVWVLHSINGEPALPEVEVTLEFSADRHILRGYAGCNHYGGPYELNDHELDIIEVEMSLQNRQYEDILWNVTIYQIEDGKLILKTDAGETLVFTSQ
jgi:heat shock protein HslJ